MKKTLAIVLALVLCLGMLAGCTQSKPQEKTLVLATSADYPPFEFHTIDENGKDVIVGIDVALAQKIAEDMGATLEIVDMSFDNLCTAMEKGEADMVISAMEQDETREKSVDFSDTYYADHPPLILIRAEDAQQYTTLDAFAGKTVGAQTATTKEDVVIDSMPGAQLLSLSSVNDLVNNLVYGKCDAVVLDYAVAVQYADSNDALVVASVELGVVAEYKVAVQDGDPKGLLESINKTIAQVLADGTMDSFIAEAEALYSEA